MSLTATIYTDGGARGNPGPAATGWLVFTGNEDRMELLQLGGTYLGTATNNIAEYKALAEALNFCKKYNEKHNQDKISHIFCNLDSELIVKQLTGVYKIKNEDLKVIFDEIKKTISEFEQVSFRHIPRAQNKHADSLVNINLDAAQK